MIYHPNESTFNKVIKTIAFWISLLGMLWLFIMMFHDDIKIPQKQVSLKIDISDSVNICLPEDDNNSKDSLFNF